jgi:secreted trypsin-like serine protease
LNRIFRLEKSFNNKVVCTGIFILLICYAPAAAQKAGFFVRMNSNVAVSSWQILDDQNLTIVRSNDYLQTDSISFSLTADRKYTLQAIISEVFQYDKILCSLELNGEPMLVVKTDSGPGVHQFPFFSGVIQEVNKIIGGASANISEFPWQVYFVAGNYACGGSILSDEWVITAAHCTKTSSGTAIPFTDMYVRVGLNNPANGSDGKKYLLSEVFVHENYNDVTYDNDIALLHIKGPINYSNASPVKIVSDADVNEGAINPGVIAWVTGWGYVHVSPNVNPGSLQKVQLPIVSNLQASTVWTKIPASDLMAGYLNGGKDACNGDSGGPLVVPVYGEYKLAGLVSWGSSNCNTYGGYTKVSLFDTWIRSKTGIAKAYLPQSPVGDSIICQGVQSSQYSITSLPSATSYEWRLYPADAGIISGNTSNASVIWDISKIGSVAVLMRVTINGAVSDWSKINVRIVKNTNILTQPRDTVVCAGNSVALTTVVEGNSLTFKWYKDNSLSNTITNQIYYPNPVAGNSGLFRCEVTGTCGTKVSRDVSLTVHPTTAVMVLSPDQVVNFGANVVLKVNAAGHNLTYQWEKDHNLLPGQNDSQLAVQNLNTTDIGQYQTIIKGTCGTAISDSIYVFVRNEESLNGSDIFIWPTLITDNFNIALSTDDKYNVMVLNSQGKLMLEKNNCHFQTSISISGYHPGVYFVTVYNTSYRKTIRIIKE